MFALLATFWFWLIAVEIIILFVCMARDSGAFATVSLVVFAPLLYWGGGVDFVTWFGQNPEYLYYGIPGYFVVGLGWALLKWVLLLVDKREELKENQASFRKKHALPDDVALTQKSVSSGHLDKETLKKWRGRDVYPGPLTAIPKARDYKYKIINWLSYWPFSMLWSLVDDFVRRISKAIYNLVHDLFQSIANKIFGDLVDS